MNNNSFRRWVFATTAMLASLFAGHSLAQQPDAPADGSATAGEMADFFSQLGNQIYEDCIFELSEEQVEIQFALIDAYTKLGASSSAARRLAVQQIEPPQLSEKCEQIQSLGKPSPPSWTTTTVAIPKKPPIQQALPKLLPKLLPEPIAPIAPLASLADKKVLQQWDCAPGVEYVTIKHKGYDRKLTGGEICNPFQDVVRKVPDAVKSFRIGYVIKSGRLFVIASDRQAAGKTIAWATSGRDVCRNNPDPDCLAARAIGPLPPGEYSFAADKTHRVSWGPRSKRMVAGIYMSKLWNRERFSRAQTAAILARGNIAIHVRLKGEMSEACLGLEPNAWAYVASLIKDGRATGVNVYIDEPYPQVAEAAPIVSASTFSLSSLFK